MKLSLTVRNDSQLYLLVGIACLLPFLLGQFYFQRLFWFGDELHLLSQIRNEGFWHWTISTFAENFVPLFKLLWGGSVYLFNGSYLAMLGLVWFTHAITVVFFLRLLLRSGIPTRLAVFTALLLGLSWTNIDTLTWTVQWSAILSITFMLLAINELLKVTSNAGSTESFSVLRYSLWVIAGTLSFSKGIIVCGALAALILVATDWWRRDRRQAALALLATLAPAIAVSSLIFAGSTGNHHLVASHLDPAQLSQMVSFGLYYFFFNPLTYFAQLPDPVHTGMNYLIAFGALKFLISFSAPFLARSRSTRLMHLLFFLLMLDLLSAAILGIGRFHEGLPNALVSRYQYSSLVSFLPALATVLWAAGRLSFRSSLYRRTVRVFGTSAALLIVTLPWAYQLPEWSRWHGLQGRRLFFQGKLRQDRPPQYGPWIGIPSFLPLEEAQAVVEEFNLH